MALILHPEALFPVAAWLLVLLLVGLRATSPEAVRQRAERERLRVCREDGAPCPRCEARGEAREADLGCVW